MLGTGLYTPGWYIIYNGLFTLLIMGALSIDQQPSYEYVILFAIVALLIGIVFFLLQSIGLYKMAKKAGMKHKWMAFFPFVNLLYVGILSGEVSFFGHRFKRAGIVAMIFQIVLTAFYIAVSLAEVILFIYLFDHIEVTTTEMGYSVFTWVDLPHKPMPNDGILIKKLYNLSEYILPVLSLVQGLFMLLLYTGFYRKYAPRRSAMFALLSIFVPFFAEISTLVMRNNEATDYEAYMRARREEYQRRQQQRYSQYYGQNPYGQNGPYGHGGNPYGQNPYGQNGPYGHGGSPYGQNSPYGHGGNPYGQNQQNAGRTQPPEEPFGEFSDSGSSTSGNGGNGGTKTSGSEETRRGSDDLFD